MKEKRDEAWAVTEENFGERLIERLREVLAIQRGEIDSVRRVVRRRDVDATRDGPLNDE